MVLNAYQFFYLDSEGDWSIDPQDSLRVIFFVYISKIIQDPASFTIKSTRKSTVLTVGLSICLYIIDLKNTLKLRKVSEVKRTNTFIIEGCPALVEACGQLR